MLAEATHRLSGLFESENTLIAAVPHLVEPLLAHDPNLTPERILAEPAKRNTAGCLVWVAANLLAQGNEPSQTTLAIVTADHKIQPVTEFRKTLNAALEIAEAHQKLVTIGIPATRPETGYGYVEADPQRPIALSSEVEAWSVQKFHEKPSSELAQVYAETPVFFWNSGMFFWTLAAFMEAFQQVSPVHHDVMLRVAEALKLGDRSAAERAFCDLPDISIDYALMERASNVAVVRATFEWDDLGSWDAVARSMPQDERGNAVSGDAILLHSADCMVHNAASDQIVTLIGAYDLMVVVTDDAILICNREQAQSVREAVAELKKRGSAKV